MDKNIQDSNENYESILKEKIYFKMSSLRGVIIQRAIDIEEKINTIIIYYFVGGADKKRADEMLHLILNREGFGLSAKIEILCGIVENTNKDFFKQNKNFKDNLQKMRNIRNDCAHRFFDSNEGMQDTINETIRTGSVSISLNLNNPKTKDNVLITKKTKLDNDSISKYASMFNSIDLDLELLFRIVKGGV